MLKLLLLTQFLGPLGGVDNMPSNVTAVVSTATLIADFAGTGAFASPVTIAAGGPVTDTRGSSATYLNGSAMATASSDQLRVQYNGALMEPAGVNSLLKSTDLTAGVWTVFNTITVTPNVCVGPSGALDMELLDNTASGSPGNSAIYQQQSLASTSVVSGSMWMVPQSGTRPAYVDIYGGGPNFATCECSLQCLDGTTGACAVSFGAGTTDCVATASFTKQCRLSAFGSLVAPTTVASLIVSPGVSGVSNNAICMGHAQIERGPFPTSTIDTDGTTVARVTETATVPAVGAVGAATGSGVMTYTPEWSSATAGADRAILSTTGLVIKWVNSSTAVSVTAGAGAGATATSAALTWAALTSHIIRWRYGGGAGSGVCVQVDAASEVCSGTFSALTPTNPLYIGGDASGGGGASIAGLKACPGNSVCN